MKKKTPKLRGGVKMESQTADNLRAVVEIGIFAAFSYGVFTVFAGLV